MSRKFPSQIKPRKFPTGTREFLEPVALSPGCNIKLHPKYCKYLLSHRALPSGDTQSPWLGNNLTAPRSHCQNVLHFVAGSDDLHHVMIRKYNAALFSSNQKKHTPLKLDALPNPYRHLSKSSSADYMTSVKSLPESGAACRDHLPVHLMKRNHNGRVRSSQPLS